MVGIQVVKSRAIKVVSTAALSFLLAFTADAAESRKSRDDAAHRPAPPARPAIRETQEVAPIAESPQGEETRLTKNWGSARTNLSDHGVDLAVIYKGDLMSNRGGGIKKGTGYLANLDIRLSLDSEKLVGWKGGSVFLYVLDDYGARPNSDFVGFG